MVETGLRSGLDEAIWIAWAGREGAADDITVIGVEMLPAVYHIASQPTERQRCELSPS